MPTNEEINAEIERRNQAKAIDAEIIRRQQLSQPEPLTFAEQAKGAIEGVATMVTGAVAQPISGIAGIAGSVNPFSDEGQGARNVEAVRSALTFEPESREGQAALAGLGDDLKFIIEPLNNLKNLLGDDAFNATGSPALATLMSTLPDAVLLAPFIPKVVPKKLPMELPKTKTPEARQQQIAETLTKGKQPEITKLVDADPAFFRAAEELGVTAEPLASFASKNQQFVAIEQGLASVPSSALDVQTKLFIGDLARRADSLIEQFGGTLDKGQLNIDFKRGALAAIEDLGIQADDVYGSLSKVLPKTQRYSATNTVAFLNEKIKELGGVDKLPSKLRKMYSDLTQKTKTNKGLSSVITGKPSITTEVINPTLGKIDQIRREIGQAINKKSGGFKDVEQGLNKALYARLAADQEAIAGAAGFGEITTAAKNLIIKRKGLEDSLQILLGKDLNQALSVNVSGALKGLAKNDIARFEKVINAIPKAQRGEVVLSAMNDVFRGSGVGQQSLSPTQFVKWYQNINRSPAVKSKLFGSLPKGSQKAIDNLFKVSSGISRALGNRVTTGRLNAMFNQDTGFIRKIVGKAIPTAVGFATGSPKAALATNATMEYLQQGTSGAQRASDLLASPQFQSIIRRSVKEGVVDGAKASAGLLKAEAALQKTKLFTRWKTTLSETQKAGLEQGGLVPYLFILKDQ